MTDVGSRSFAEYLSGLGEGSLTALLRARPDVLLPPVPRDFSQLAQRLGGAQSLGAALRTANRDMVIVSQAIVALGVSATVPGLIRLLGVSASDGPRGAVRSAVKMGCSSVAWVDDRGHLGGVGSGLPAGTGVGQDRRWLPADAGCL